MRVCKVCKFAKKGIKKKKVSYKCSILNKGVSKYVQSGTVPASCPRSHTK